MALELFFDDSPVSISSFRVWWVAALVAANGQPTPNAPDRAWVVRREVNPLNAHRFSVNVQRRSATQQMRAVAARSYDIRRPAFLPGWRGDNPCDTFFTV